MDLGGTGRGATVMAGGHVSAVAHGRESSPNPADGYHRDVSASHLLARFVMQRRCALLLDGVEESAAFLFDPRVFLPVVAMQAQFRARALLGFQMGAEFEKYDRALMGVRVKLPRLDGSGAGACRAAFLVDAAERVFGLQPQARIECMPVLNLYMEQGLLAQPERSPQWPVAITVGQR